MRTLVGLTLVAMVSTSGVAQTGAPDVQGTPSSSGFLEFGLWSWGRRRRRRPGQRPAQGGSRPPRNPRRRHHPTGGKPREPTPPPWRPAAAAPAERWRSAIVNPAPTAVPPGPATPCQQRSLPSPKLDRTCPLRRRPKRLAGTKPLRPHWPVPKPRRRRTSGSRRSAPSAAPVTSAPPVVQPAPVLSQPSEPGREVHAWRVAVAAAALGGGGRGDGLVWPRPKTGVAAAYRLLIAASRHGSQHLAMHVAAFRADAFDPGRALIGRAYVAERLRLNALLLSSPRFGRRARTAQGCARTRMSAA